MSEGKGICRPDHATGACQRRKCPPHKSIARGSALDEPLRGVSEEIATGKVA
jgi:hypothetical protein